MATRRDVDAVIAQKWAGGVPGQIEMPLDVDPANEEPDQDDPPAA